MLAPLTSNPTANLLQVLISIQSCQEDLQRCINSFSNSVDAVVTIGPEAFMSCERF